MSEWKILKNGILWDDRIDSEEEALESIIEYNKLDNGDEYVCVKMTIDELNAYR